MKRRFGSFFRRYLPFTKGAMEESFAYRSRFVFWLMFEVFYLFIAFFLWKSVFSAHAADQGIPLEAVRIGLYDFPSMVFYVFFERIVFGLTSMSASNFMEEDIDQGTIALRLIKPLDYRKQLFFQSLGSTAVNALIFSLPFTVGLVIYGFATNTAFTPDLLSILFFVLSLALGGLVNFLISFLFGMILFLTLNSFGMWQLKDAIERVFSGNLIPISLFPLWLRTVSAALPFAQTRYVPITFIMGGYAGDFWGAAGALGVQALWVVGLWLLSSFAWSRAKRRIVVQGG